MTREKAIDKMEFCKRAYQRMIDENSQEGVFVGKGFEGKWKADTPLYKVYEDMRDACDMSIKALEQNPSGDMEEIEEIINCDANAEIKLKMISNIVYSKPHFFKALKKEPKYCDRNICVSNEYNGIGCDECEVTKSQKPKTGHWIMTSDYLTTAYGSIDYVKCSCCGEDSLEEGDYCPNCGAKMVEPQESEDI